MSKYGPYVRKRVREDGSCRYYQAFETRWRPKNFPKTVVVFVQPYPGEPSEKDHAEIIRRACETHDALIMARAASGTPGRHRTLMPVNDWTVLADQLATKSLWWHGLSEASQKDMRSHFSVIARSFDGMPHLSPANITTTDINVYVGQRKLTPGTQLKYQGAFNRLLEQAVGQGMRLRHEPIRFRVKRKTRKRIRLWDEADVDALSGLAEEHGEVGMADLIRAGYETGVRLIDLRQLRFGVDYKDGELYFLTNKTDVPIMLPLSRKTCASLDARYRMGELLFPSQTGKVFSSNSLGRKFRQLADTVPKYRSTGNNRSNPDLISLRHLRHSAIVAFFAKNVPVPLIASVTGHSIKTVDSVIEVYCPRNPLLARRAMEMRFGLHALGTNPRPVIGWDERTVVAALPRPEKPKALSAPRSASTR